MDAKIKISFENLLDAINTTSGVTNDRLLAEDLRNIFIWIKEGKARFAVKNTQITSFVDVDCEVIFDEGTTEEAKLGEYMVALRARDMCNVVNSFTGMSRTVCDNVTIDIKGVDELIGDTIFVFHEVASDPDAEGASRYEKDTRCRVTRVKLAPKDKQKFADSDVEADGVPVNGAEVNVYLDSLIPTLNKDGKDQMSNKIFFKGDKVYTVPATYAAIMENRLGEYITDFVIGCTAAISMRDFLKLEDITTFAKIEMPNNIVRLVLTNSKSKTVIQASGVLHAFNIESFNEVPDSGITFDKAYLLDVLKHVGTGDSEITVKIAIENGGGTFEIKNKKIIQDIPVLRSKGEGTFEFNIDANWLSSLMFSHVDYFEDTLFMYLGVRNNYNTMTIADNSGIWSTRVTKLKPAGGGYQW